MTEEDYPPLLRTSLPDEHLKALGLIVIRFSLLESLLQDVIWGLLRLDHTRGLIATTDLGFRILTGKYEAAMHEFQPELAKSEEFKGLLKLIRESARTRNLYVHGEWYEIEGNEDLAIFAKSGGKSGKIRSSISTKSVKEMKEAAHTILASTAALISFTLDHYLPRPAAR